MKNNNLLTLAFLLICNVSFSQTQLTNIQFRTLSQKLTTIEKSQDLESLNNLLDNNVLVFLPDAPPIYSKEVVLDLFKYSWGKNKNNTEIKYEPTSIKKNNNTIYEEGMYQYRDGNRGLIKMSYSIVGIEINSGPSIKEIVYNNSKKEIQDLPKPTGIYKVGQSTHFYSKNENRTRPIAFQIWYPTKVDSEDNLPFQSKEVALAITNFLGWPSFNNSFTRLMNSNAVKNVPIAPNKKFPVVIYNHGYGGATPVYQTVFEELASHGYVVVSVGHQDESAFLIREDGSVIENSPQNEFYTKREPELNNRTIGIEQSTILNSDDLNDLNKSYKKLVQLSPLHTESVNLWALDTKNVIIELKKINKHNLLLKGGFDFNNMGIFGHSVGGAVAGDFSSKETFKAGINIDGFQFGNLINSKLKIPFLFISSNEEDNRYLRVLPFANASEKTTYQAIIKGFSHGSFSDLQLFTPNGNDGIQLQRELILGFFNKYLKKKNIKFQSVKNRFENLTLNKLK